MRVVIEIKNVVVIPCGVFEALPFVLPQIDHTFL
jgi:hypothetical protein